MYSRYEYVEDFNDEFDMKFANYSLNEIPLYLDSDEKKIAASIYGNSLVGAKNGLVYRGMRINSSEHLDVVKNIKNKLDNNKKAYIELHLASSSHDKGTAQSFQEYVKSYDPMITLGELKDALKRGSSGEYGSYLLTLKPKKEQVIYNTSKGNITKFAESELILDGKVEVVDILIYEPFNKSNYLNFYNDLDVLNLDKTSNFYLRWLNHHKLRIPVKSQKEMLSKIKTYKDFVIFLFKSINISNDLISSKVLNEFIAKNKYTKKVLSDITINFQDTNGTINIIFKYVGKKVNLPSLLKHELLSGKFRNIFTKKINMYFKQLKFSSFDQLLHNDFTNKNSIKTKTFNTGTYEFIRKLEYIYMISSTYDIFPKGFEKLIHNIKKDLIVHIEKAAKDYDYMGKFLRVLLSEGSLSYQSKRLGIIKDLLYVLNDNRIIMLLYKIYSSSESVNKAKIDIRIISSLSKDLLTLSLNLK